MEHVLLRGSIGILSPMWNETVENDSGFPSQWKIHQYRETNKGRVRFVHHDRLGTINLDYGTNLFVFVLDLLYVLPCGPVHFGNLCLSPLVFRINKGNSA